MTLLPHVESLQRAKGIGVSPATLIDVGAAKGDWSVMALDVWPSMRAHLMEAAPHWDETLRKRCAADERLSYTLAAASDVAEDSVPFWINPNSLFGGQLRAGVKPDAPNLQAVPTTTIDDVVAALGLPAPYMIKLDTHGHEQAILAGARKTLEQTELLVFETYNFGVESRRFGQMAVHVEEECGFRVYDLGEPMWRPYDNALWQLDLFCLPAEHPAFGEMRFD